MNNNIKWTISFKWKKSNIGKDRCGDREKVVGKVSDDKVKIARYQR